MDNEKAVVLGLGADVWYSIAKWAKKNNKLTAVQRKLAYTIGMSFSEKWELTEKQVSAAISIIQTIRAEGFNKGDVDGAQ